MAITDKDIQALVKRRHPEYDQRKKHWDFLAATYTGGRAWFQDNIFRYYKEGDVEYRERLERAYRFNHSREVVNLINKYLFKESISRNEQDAPQQVVDFWKKATRQGLTIDEFMGELDLQSSIYGRIWIVVDSTVEDSVESVADQKRVGGGAYAYWISPQQMLDCSYDDDGQLLWALICEVARDDADPFKSSGNEFLRYRLWTRTGWALFREEPKRSGRSGSKKVVLEDQGEHELGVVPIFPLDCSGQSESPYFSPSLIEDIAYLDRAVANYLSNLDAVIQDQTFSQLAIPVQGLLPGDDDHKKVMEFGTKRVFTYDGENGAQPFFMSPDPKQASIISATIQQIINEIYHSVGVAGERTKQDNAAGIDNSSGAAKMYDFQRVNSLLVAKSGRLRLAESRMIELVALWMGVSEVDPTDLITYPESFDIRGLTDEFGVATNLQLLQAPESVRRFQMEVLVDKIFPNLTKQQRKEILTDLDSYPPKVVAPEAGAPNSGVDTSAKKVDADKEAHNDKVREKDPTE